MPGNPFALLVEDDDEDLGTVKVSEENSKVLKPTQAQASVPAKNPKAAAAKEAPKAPATTAAPAKDVSKDAAAPKPPRQRSAKPKAAPQESAPVVADGDAFEKARDPNRARSARGPRDGQSDRQQVSERQFGNQRNSHHASHAKEGGKGGRGAHNWGNAKDAKDISTEVLDDTKKEEAPAAEESVSATPAAGEAAPAEAEAPKEEEPKVFSLDEYKLQQQARRAAAHALPAQRKAGEGEDNARWGDAQELVKNDEEDAADKISGEQKTQRAFKKQTVSIDVKFASSEAPAAPRDGFRGGRGGASRGGRGASRGGSSRGGRSSGPFQGAKSPAAAFQVSDADFPSL